MIRQVLIACGLFEAAFVLVSGFNPNIILRDTTLLISNALFISWLAMEASRVRLGHKGVEVRGNASRAFLAISFFSMLLAVWDRSSAYELLRSTLSGEFAVAGLLIFPIGVFLRHLSIKTLGRFFVTKVQVVTDHQLVMEGIYNVVRHPSYTGLVLGFLGMLLFLRSTLATVAFLLIGIPAYIYRIKIEEKALFDKFGEQYTAYRHRTYALFPPIY